MVDKALIQQLQSLNLTQRRDAIMALGRIKDRDAIPHLITIAENDPESDLRELARKAAAYIDKNAPVVSVKPFTMPFEGEDAEEDADGHEDEDAEADFSPPVNPAAALIPDYDEPTEAEIGLKQDGEWAERYIELAWQSHYTSDRASAEIYLRKALERSPASAELEATREAAAKIMNMTPERAIAALMKPTTTSRSSSTNATRKTTGGTARPPSRAITAVRAITGATALLGEDPDQDITLIEDGSMLTMIFDLVMFFLMVSALELIAMLAVDGLLREALTTPRTPTDSFTSFIRDFFVMAEAASAIELLRYALITGLLWLVVYLVLSFLTHIVAFSLFKGEATFPRLIRKSYMAYALVLPVLSTALAVTIYIVYIPQDPTPWQTGFAVAALAGSFLIAWRVGVAYHFEFARGCFTIVLTSFAALCFTLTISLALIVARVGPFAELAENILPR